MKRIFSSLLASIFILILLSGCTVHEDGNHTKKEDPSQKIDVIIEGSSTESTVMPVEPEEQKNPTRRNQYGYSRSKYGAVLLSEGNPYRCWISTILTSTTGSILGLPLSSLYRSSTIP